MMKSKRRTRQEARRLFRACLEDGILDEGRARRVAARIAGTRRRESLSILSHFRRLVRLEQGRHQAVVESAGVLPPDLRATIERGLLRAYGPGLHTSFSVEPSLIGGVCVKVASDVYDGSVRAALAALQDRF
jgi:F-type H+-transporting ATPase subunit delta